MTKLPLIQRNPHILNKHIHIILISFQIYKLLYFPIFEFTGSSYVTYIAPQSENIFPFCDLSKCGLTGVFLYFGTAPVSENPPKKIPLKENLSKTYFSENKKTHLRNIHCPTDMSENFHICCRFARPGPTPSSISGIACSVCTVDLAFC